MVAVAMNGEPLPAEHGFPARLVVAGLYGYVSATKWLDSIDLVPWEDFDGYWVPRGWSKEGPIKIASRIDVPRSGATVDAGQQADRRRGLAARRRHRQGRGAGRRRPVDRRPSSATPRATTRGSSGTCRGTRTSGEHKLRVRATNAKGEVADRGPGRPGPDGATGWHTRTVRVR